MSGAASGTEQPESRARPTGCCLPGTRFRRPRRPGPRAARTAPGTFGVADPGRRRGHPRDPRRRPLGRRPARPVGRGRGRPGHRLLRRPRLLHAQGRAQPAPVRLVPRRPRRARRSSRRPGCGSSPTAGSTCSSRRARCSSTSSRIQPAGLRRPDPPVRGAQGAPGGRRAVRRRAEAAACRIAARGRSRSSPARPAPSGSDICHVLARRWPLTRVVLVACQVQGDGAPASHRGRVPAGRALDARRLRPPGAAGRRARP